MFTLPFGILPTATGFRLGKELEDLPARLVDFLSRDLELHLLEGVQTVLEHHARHDAQFFEDFLQAVMLLPTMLAVGLRVTLGGTISRVTTQDR